MKIILASQSPQRKDLLDLMNLKYEIMVSDVDETFVDNLPITEQSKRLAYIKAKEVFNKTTGDRIIIGSDSMVIKDGKIYGKPKDEKDAFNILTDLQNDTHQVITSLAVLAQKDGKYLEFIDYDITEVHFKPMSEKEILDWIATGKSLNKAGGYGVQSEFAVYIDKIVGNYYTVVGLPIHKLNDILKRIS